MLVSFSSLIWFPLSPIIRSLLLKGGRLSNDWIQTNFSGSWMQIWPKLWPKTSKIEQEIFHKNSGVFIKEMSNNKQHWRCLSFQYSILRVNNHLKSKFHNHRNCLPSHEGLSLEIISSLPFYGKNMTLINLLDTKCSLPQLSDKLSSLPDNLIAKNAHNLK